MARVTDGINGGLSGKLGEVIFYTMNGGNYMRSLPSKKRKKTPPTPRQALQRERFVAMQEWLRPITPLVREAFRYYAPRQTGHNAAMSYNLKNALVRVDGKFEVNPEVFSFSVGPLPEAYRPSVHQDGAVVRFKWDIEKNALNVNHLDRTMLLLYREGQRYSEFLTYGNERWRLSDSLSLEDYKEGDVCHAYIAFISAKNQQVSNSVYVGMLTIEAF